MSISREVVPGYIWTISKPFLRFNRAKIGGRASIVKLSNGNLFVISPTPIEEGTKVWVDSIGTVKYLVAPDIAVRPLYSPSSDLGIALHVSERLEGFIS
jgi:hypothetical protein